MINTLHPEYIEWAPYWEKCRDFYLGNKAVKSKGKQYLPLLSGQGATSYQSYLMRSNVYGATARTIHAMVGSVMRKAPTIELPKKLEYLLESATPTRQTLSEFINVLLSEVLLTGRGGVLVDRPEDGGLPYFVFYPAENIINWNDDFVVLKEDYYRPNPDNKYELERASRYRELSISPEGYVVQVWEDVAGDLQVTRRYVPESFSDPLPYMPFLFVSPTGIDMAVDKPPLLDLVDENHQHYLTTADLENGRHWTGLPTPVVTGVQQDPEKPFSVPLGSEEAIILPDSNCKAFFMEFQGQGLTSLENALKEKEQRMAALGARLVEPRNTSTNETAESARIRQMGQATVLAGIISSVEIALNTLLHTISDWERIKDDINVVLNRELLDISMDANMLTALTAAVQAGTITYDTYWFNLEQAGITPPLASMDEGKKVFEEKQKKEEALNNKNNAPNPIPVPAVPKPKLPIDNKNKK